MLVEVEVVEQREQKTKGTKALPFSNSLPLVFLGGGRHQKGIPVFSVRVDEAQQLNSIFYREKSLITYSCVNPASGS